MMAALFSPTDQLSEDALLKHYLDKEGDDDEAFVAKDTQKERDRIWTAWLAFAGRKELDSSTFWRIFASNPTEPGVQPHIKTFLHEYVRNSVTERVVLGPEERALVRTVNSVYSVIEVWRKLVASADYNVLRHQRSELRKRGDRQAAALLFLKWEQEGECREGPAYVIVKWILVELSVTAGLDTAPLYVKVEATAADIIAVLLTLYHRAEDIPAKPSTRVSFHAAVLLGGTGGFRPKTLENLKCEQFTLSLVRDPTDRAKTRVVVTPKIRRNKIKLREMTSRYRKSKFIEYSTTVVPFPLLCLASLVIARALEMDALDTSFLSARDLFNRPVLGNVDSVEIPWKPEFLKETLFELTYQEFHDIWTRTLLVMGCRKPIRLYSLRLGAGSRMDEGLSSALRNYVMSHTGGVFETEYQTGHVRPNLASLAFGEKSIGRDEELFNDLRKMTLSRDEGAPISVPKEQIAKFKARDDVTKLQAQVQAASDKKEKNKLRSKISTTIAACTRLQLEVDRQAYFKNADKLRLQGLVPAPTPGAGGPGTAAILTPFFKPLIPPAGTDSEKPDSSQSTHYIDAIMRYLSPTLVTTTSQDTAASTSKSTSSCLVCLKELTNRSALTRHFRDVHLHDTTFDKPLVCRVCRQAGITGAVFHDAAQWCNHLEHSHGKSHAPNFHAVVDSVDSPPSSSLACLLCEAPMASMSLLSSHLNRVEIQRYRGGRCLPCPVCLRSGKLDVKPLSIWEWFTHARTTHDWAVPRELCLICGQLCVPGPGFQRHFTTQHKDMLNNDLACAACEASGFSNKDIKPINGISDLLEHGRERHSSNHVMTIAAGEKRKADEELTGPATKHKNGGHIHEKDVASFAPSRHLTEQVDIAAENDRRQEDVQRENSSFVVKEYIHDAAVYGSHLGQGGGECRTEHMGIQDPDFYSRVDPRLLVA